MKSFLVRLLRRLGLEPLTIRTMRAMRAFGSVKRESRVVDTWRPVDPPSGHTIDSLREVMFSFSIDGSPPGSLDGYVHDSFFRFLHTWSMVKDERGACLELGGNPYFTTWLLHEHTDLDVTVANYFGGDDAFGRQTLEWTQDGVTRSRVIDFSHFNMEESRFPFNDASFEVVLYCEIIEHLLMNPVHTLREIHRVLVPGGLVVVTTPNVARLGNVMSLVDGRGIYDPYSGFGPYGRHNREYSLDELRHLLEFAGFHVDYSFTADAHPEDHSHHASFQSIASLVSTRSDSLGQYMFVAARASGESRKGLPGRLFRSYPDDLIDMNW